MAIIDGLIAYYKLDENAANTDVEDIHGENDGTASSNTNTWYDEDAIINSAFDLERGDTDNIDITGIAGASGSHSFQFWINAESIEPADQNVLFDANGGRLICALYDGTYRYYDGAWRDFLIEGTTGSWKHVVFVFDSVTHKGYLYINSVLQATEPAYTTVDISGTTKIGSFQNDANYFDGIIDEVGIWDKALSQEEVIALYNGGAGFAYPFTGVEVSTNAATNVTYNSATLNGELTDAAGETVSLCFRYREQGESWEDDIEVETGITTPQSYSYPLTGLNPEITYEFQAVVKWNAEEDTGSILDFTTEVAPIYEYEPVYTKMEIEGTTYADVPKITVDRTIGEFSATSNFTAEFNNFNGKYSDTFSLNDEVIIYADRGTDPPTTKIFTGIIEDINFKGDVEKEKIVLVGRDYGAILQDMTVQPVIYKNEDAGVIARQVMLNNTEELLTANNMDTSTETTIERIGFNHINVFSALQELAELSDYYFYVDTDKDVHFEAKSSTSSGHTFDNTNVHSGVFKKDDREIYNKIFVYGARVLTGANDVGGTWGEGETGSIFTLSYKPHNTRVFVSDVLQQPGGIYEMTNPATESGLKYLVDFNEQKIIFVSGAEAGENVPASGTSNVSVDYERFTPLLKYVDNDDSITSYGPKTKIIKDDNLKSFEEVSKRATTFIADNKDPKIQGDLDIKGVVDITPGNTCVVDLPWHGISSQTYTILSASYNFNKRSNRADRVLHITVNKKLSDFTDIMKEQMIKLKQFEVGPLEGEYTSLLTRTRYADVDNHYELWQRNINDNFVFHSAKHGLLESEDPRIGTGVLGSTFIVSGGGF